MPHVAVKPELIDWACERSGKTQEDLVERFPKLPEWRRGERCPTLKQLEDFARAVHLPCGYLFLSSPPEESLPIPDFRTLAGQVVRRPSPNLLDMIHMCQARQSWFRAFALAEDYAELPFVGSVTTEAPPESVAARMRREIGFGFPERRECRGRDEAIRQLVKRTEAAGVLVMISGVVVNNNHRPLDLEEFRGFALPDRLAPLVFVNGADAKSAQMFTLAHELAHVWLGESALSNPEVAPRRGSRKQEAWCNAVAAEFLVPMDELRSEVRAGEDPVAAASRLAGAFKVSKQVILRRLLDGEWLSRPGFDAAWKAETMRVTERSWGDGDGGNFYATTLSRASRRFARALVSSTLEGRTLYRDAFHMLGVFNIKTFNSLGKKLGVMN